MCPHTARRNGFWLCARSLCEHRPHMRAHAHSVRAYASNSLFLIHAGICSNCVRILLYMCPHTAIHASTHRHRQRLWARSACSFTTTFATSFTITFGTTFTTSFTTSLTTKLGCTTSLLTFAHSFCRCAADTGGCFGDGHRQQGNKCVCILQYMCPHTAIYLSA
jgi:hypothetical protein